MPKVLIKPETPQKAEEPVEKPAAASEEPVGRPAAEPDVSLYARLYEECVRRYGEDKCAVVKQMYSDAVVELARRAVEEELRRRGVEYRGRICLEI